MAKNTSFVIGDHFASFVEAQVAAGRYGSASDVVRAALRLLEEQETKLTALRAALIEGETSGASTPFDFEVFIARKCADGARIHEAFTLSPRAQADIEEIWNYTVKHWNANQAEVYLRKIKAAIEAVADDPRLGQPCDEVRAGYRKYPAGSHLLFYRTTPDRIDIVLILHQRMDFERHL